MVPSYFQWAGVQDQATWNLKFFFFLNLKTSCYLDNLAGLLHAYCQRQVLGLAPRILPQDQVLAPGFVHHHLECEKRQAWMPFLGRHSSCVMWRTAGETAKPRGKGGSNRSEPESWFLASPRTGGKTWGQRVPTWQVYQLLEIGRCPKKWCDVPLPRLFFCSKSNNVGNIWRSLSFFIEVTGKDE